MDDYILAKGEAAMIFSDAEFSHGLGSFSRQDIPPMI
jgi:hypothetical protein